MSVSEELVQTIKVKVQDLTNRAGQLKKERDELRTENDTLKSEMSKQQVIIAGKESEVTHLKSKLQEINETETKKVEADNAAMKNRISELVQEIDRCIIMLNK